MTGKQLKNSILQWAIQGKLVPQDPNDEPASVLLEKIRAEKARLVKEGKIKKDKKESIIFRGEDNSHYEKFADGTVVCIDDEIPFEIPDTWEWVRLGGIVAMITDGTHNRPKYVENGVPFLSVKDISSGKIIFDDCKYISQEDHALLSARCFPKYGDLLITKVGSNTGIPVLVDTDIEFSLFVSVALIKFIANTLYNRYIVYLINSPLVQSQVKVHTRGVGNPNWVLKDIANTLIPLPPLAEQHRIVDKIQEVLPVVEQYSNAQLKLDNLNKEIKPLLRKSILQDAIQGRLVQQDDSDEPASVLLQRIKGEKLRLVKEGKLKKKDVVDSVIFKGDDNRYYEQIGKDVVNITDEIPFDVPDSWEWIRFGNLIKMNIGKTPPRGDSQYWSNGIYPWVSISDMNDYGLIGSTKEKISLLASEKIMGEISPIGTLLMSFKLTVGKTSILNVEAFHNEAIISIYPYIDKDFATRDYLFYILPLISNLGESKDAIKGKTLNSKSLFNLLVPLPPINEQNRIVRKIEELYALL